MLDKAMFPATTHTTVSFHYVVVVVIVVVVEFIQSFIPPFFHRLIRRYHCCTSQFSFEAGRRCASGAGLFNFNTIMADKLIMDVGIRTLAILENQHDGDSDLAMTGGAGDGDGLHGLSRTTRGEDVWGGDAPEEVGHDHAAEAG